MTTFMEELPMKNELRECVWSGKPAWFHRWADKSEIIAPSMMVGGRNGGELRYTVAIIELTNGTVKEVMPEDIQFCYATKMKSEAHWVFLANYGDANIYKCSECGNIIVMNSDQGRAYAPSICGSCKSRMNLSGNTEVK